MRFEPYRMGIVLLAAAVSTCAQDGPRGHWTGSLGSPQAHLTVEIDLDKTAGGWTGSMSIPAQGSSGIQLEAITFADGKCTFHIKGAAGAPGFAGTLSADGKTLEGEF